MNELPSAARAWTRALRTTRVLMLGVAAQWACAAADEGHVLHRAQSGETVHSLVAEYLQGQGALAELIHVNGLINPEQVIAGTVVKLPRQHLKFRPSVAKVTRLNCTTAMRTDVVPATPLQMGDLLGEGAVVRIPSGCQVVMTLEDESSLRMLSGAVLKFGLLRQRVLETAPAVRVELLDGRVAVDVPRKRQALAESLEVRTPTSVAGVRGTEFRVAFDAQDRQSGVEVLAGAVGARGLSELQEQKVAGGQGVAISASGQSLPVEALLAPPRYDAASSQRNGGDQLVFQGDSLARSFVLSTAQDVLFMEGLQDRGRLPVPVFPAAGLGTRAMFMRWAAVSPSGLVGETADYGLCQGEKLQDVWRCDLVFSFSGLSQPRLKLERMTEQADADSDKALKKAQRVLDTPIDTAKDPVWLFRNLQVGHYRWQVDHQTDGGRTGRLAGAFQLMAIRAQD